MGGAEASCQGPECSMWGEQSERVGRGAVSLEQNIWVRS